MSDTNPNFRPPIPLAILRKGSKGDLVGLVQTFLRGRNNYHGAVDEDFGELTEKAVEDFQDEAKLKPDGEVGNATWGALMARGLVVLPSDAHHEDQEGPNWPPAPVGMPPLTGAQRGASFGVFEFDPEPILGNPEAIRITHRPPEFRIIEVEISALRGVNGFPGSGKVFFHAKVARQLQLLIGAWKDAGLLDRIVGWGGTYAPRFVRGSRTVLSPHAWGTAFDINVTWNSLGAQPALAGRRGSVRELVPLANEHGFYWGGHFKRPDGMHFEVARVMG